MAEPKTLLTLEDFLNLPEEGHRYELLDGALVEMAPPSIEHGRIEIKIGHYFLLYAEAHDGGLISGGECSIVLRRGPDRIRRLDVCFWLPERVPSEAEQRRTTEIIPDIVIEVISPSDTVGNVQQKIEEWLDAGARLVWAVYPITQTVIAYRSATDIRLFTRHDMIDAAPVLSEFSCLVANFFR